MTRERLREVVRGQVATSRREQGMPEHVTDGRFLGDLAAEVVDPSADTVELPAIGGDRDAAA